MATKQARAESTSTPADQGDNSAFSENATASTSTHSTPLITLGDESPDLEDIDKETLYSISSQQRADSILDRPNTPETSSPPGLKIINGSTLGGVDPLNQLLREWRIKPRFWHHGRDEAEMDDPPPKKRSRPLPPDPKYFDALPYSCEAYDRRMTSGFDSTLDPVDGDVFWEKLQARWNLSMYFETVDERRDQFEMSPIFDEPAGPAADEQIEEEKKKNRG